MASSDKHLNRRQRQRQFKQQLVSKQRTATRIPTERFGSHLPEVMKGYPLSMTARQHPMKQSGLNWWQRLFRQPVSESRQRRRQVELSVRSRRPAGMPARRKDVRHGRNQQGLIPLSGSRQGQLLPKIPAQKRRPGILERRHSASLSGTLKAQPILPNRMLRSPKQNPQSPASRSMTSRSTPLKPRSSLSKSKSRRRVPSPLVYGIRLLTLGIGLGVLVGTLLSILDPASRDSSGLSPQINPSQIKIAAIGAAPSLKAEEEPTSSPQPSQEIAPLKTAFASLVAQHPQLTPGVFIVDLDTDAYLDWQGNSTFSAASTIKIPIMIAFFQDVDAGKIRLDELLTLKREFIASGSGDMRKKRPGGKYTALETVTKMITISDNTATNMLIDRLGGQEVLNQRFQEWGLGATAIRNKLPDVAGTNTTSPKELANLLARVNQGELVSASSRDRLLKIMRQTQRNHLLPRGLGAGATIAHKTGNIGSLVADAGLIELPNGKHYIAAVMVKRPRNDARAEKLIRQISRVAYQYFNPPSEMLKTPSGAPDIPNNSTVTPATPKMLPGNPPAATARREWELESGN